MHVWAAPLAVRCWAAEHLSLSNILTSPAAQALHSWLQRPGSYGCAQLVRQLCMAPQSDLVQNITPAHVHLGGWHSAH